MFPKRQDRRISLIGGVILLAATLAAGFSVFAVMQRQTEAVLSRSLQATLQSNVRLFESQIQQVLADTRTVATRPFLIQNLQSLGNQPDDAAAALALQRAASSFIGTGLDAVSFSDAQGRPVAGAGRFSPEDGARVALDPQGRSFLLWRQEFIVQSQLDMLDAQGVRAGTVTAQARMPLLSQVFRDVGAMGQSAEFGLCAPLAEDKQQMDCFLGRVSGMEIKRLPLIVDGKALPMHHALLGKTGITTALDYRREIVVAAYMPVAAFGFGMVLKLDQNELYAPVFQQLRFIVPLLLALVLVGMLLINFVVSPLVRKLVRSERAARDTSAQLRDITDTVPAWITYIDAGLRVRFHNQAYQKAFGLSHEQIDGKDIQAVIGDELFARIKPHIEEVLSGYPVVYERSQKNLQGDLRDYLIHYFPRYDDADGLGKVIGFYSLVNDVTELKRIDRIKSEFVSTVSHELRTPLTSIRGSLGLIAGGVAGQLPDAVKSLVEIAKNNCERLIRLINDILDIEKIESGKMQLDLKVLVLQPLLAQALAANEGFGAAKNLHLTLVAPEEPLRVQADSDRLTQVVTNLLSNAMKFSPGDATVEVHVLRAGSVVRVEVRDQGPGIPDEFRKRIFQKFSQADSSDTRQNAGTGLGLNISRAIIERLDGSIGFESKVGAGSTFYFELPEWTEAESVEPAELSPQASAGAAPASLPARPQVLVCEDDRDIARLISMMLNKGGFEVDVAYSAAMALDRLHSAGPYAAMTVDLKLPDQDGLSLIRTLRSRSPTQDLPIVVLSASAGTRQIECNNQPLNVSDWLDKPIDENQLVLALRRAINRMAEGKPRILHIEDDLDVQRITAAIAQDFAIFEFAASLDEARTRLRERSFELVLLDLTLQGGSGWDLLADIKALPHPPPVVVFTAAEVSRAEGARVAAVLVKAQTSNAELLQTLQRVLT